MRQRCLLADEHLSGVCGLHHCRLRDRNERGEKTGVSFRLHNDGCGSCGRLNLIADRKRNWLVKDSLRRSHGISQATLLQELKPGKVGKMHNDDQQFALH